MVKEAGVIDVHRLVEVAERANHGVVLPGGTIITAMENAVNAVLAELARQGHLVTLTPEAGDAGAGT